MQFPPASKSSTEERSWTLVPNSDTRGGGEFRGWVSRLMGGGGGGSEGRITLLPDDLPGNKKIKLRQEADDLIVNDQPDLLLGLTGTADIDDDLGVDDANDAGIDDTDDSETGGEKSVIMSDSLISLRTLPDRENCPGCKMVNFHKMSKKNLNISHIENDVFKDFLSISLIPIKGVGMFM